MAVEKSMCANENCPKHRVYSGGKFTVRLSDGKTFCSDCFQWAGDGATCRNLWDFTTTHFDGHPVHVKNGHHLDQLCKQHGVSNHARENFERNW